MGSKYSSELKQEQNHDAATTSFSKSGNENGAEALNIFQILSCWRCICFRPRHFKATRNRQSTESLNNNNNKSFGDPHNKEGSDNHAMQLKPSVDGICCEKSWKEKLSESQVEIYQNNQNVTLAESERAKKRAFAEQKSFDNVRHSTLNQRPLGYSKRSISLKSCRASYGHSVSNSIGASNGSNSDIKKNFLSRLMSLSVDGKQRPGYVKQVDVVESPSFQEYGRIGYVEDAEEDKGERDELLDHGSYSCERRPDFLRPVDSMDYFDSTPSTEDKFTEACLKFQSGNDNLSTDLYEESCLENLESFCDKSVLLASMDTIDLGSSLESLLPGSQDNVAFELVFFSFNF